MLQFWRQFHQFKSSPNTVGALLNEWKYHFEKAHIPEPQKSIENILAHLLGTRMISDVYKSLNHQLSNENLINFKILCKKRLKREPIQYIIGEWDFRQLNLKLKPPVFIPRPETEQLIDLILNNIKKFDCKNILEIGCGSGAISLSLLKEADDINIIAIDQSSVACELTKKNAEHNMLSSKISIIQNEIGNKNFLNFLDQKFDLIISNPPYVTSDEMVDLQPEIKLYEDHKALDGGEDGLDVIRIILEISSRLLMKGRRLFMEINPHHSVDLGKLILKQYVGRLVHVKNFHDYSDKIRFVEIMKI